MKFKHSLRADHDVGLATVAKDANVALRLSTNKAVTLATFMHPTLCTNEYTSLQH